MSALSILVADQDGIVRSNLSNALGSPSGWTVCGVAGDGREAVSLAAKLRPDVVVLGLAMAGLNGLDAAARIRRGSAATRILVRGGEPLDRMVTDAYSSGANGYIENGGDEDAVVKAVKTLAAGKCCFGPGVTEAGLHEEVGRTKGPRSRRPSSLLTTREREIVQLVGEGYTSKEIAASLGISVKTVETHRSNLMRKLQVHTVGEVVRYAIRHRIAGL